MRQTSLIRGGYGGKTPRKKKLPSRWRFFFFFSKKKKNPLREHKGAGGPYRKSSCRSSKGALKARFFFLGQNLNEHEKYKPLHLTGPQERLPPLHGRPHNGGGGPGVSKNPPMPPGGERTAPRAPISPGWSSNQRRINQSRKTGVWPAVAKRPPPGSRLFANTANISPKKKKKLEGQTERDGPPGSRFVSGA